MTVRVYFHQHAPGPESDPEGRCGLQDRAPVAQGGHRRPQRTAAGADRPGAGGRLLVVLLGRHGRMLRRVRISGDTGFADFRDFRRLVPNATSSYGSTALLAELDATLKQFPTVRRTLYAFNGDVPAFYEWLQLEVPSTPSGNWRAIAPAPIAGRDGPAAVWTGRQLLVWGGHGRIPGAVLRPLRDGAADDPAGDRWQPLPTAPAGVQGTSAAAAWTGTRMLVWDGSSTDDRTTRAVYDPAGARRRRRRRIATGPPTAR